MGVQEENEKSWEQTTPAPDFTSPDDSGVEEEIEGLDEDDEEYEDLDDDEEEDD